MIDDELRIAGQDLRSAAHHHPLPEPGAFERGRRGPTVAVALVAVVTLVFVASRLLERDPSPAVVTSETTSTSIESSIDPTPDADVESSLGPHQEQIDIGPLEIRHAHSVVWTGEEMVVFGGSNSSGWSRPDFADGAAYDPATGEWRAIASSPEGAMADHIAYWSGTEMVVVGGGDPASTTAAAYDPRLDDWRRLADAPFGVTARSGWASSGTHLFAWVPDEQVVVQLEASTGAWSTIAGPPHPIGTAELESVGGRLVLVGSALDGSIVASTWDPTTREWTSESTTAGDIDLDTRAATTGDRVLVWSNNGAESATLSFDPETVTWSTVETIPVASCEGMPLPLAVGDDVVAFAMCSRAAVFDASRQEWDVLDVGYTGDGRYAVWTGRSILSWGDPCCFGSASGAITSVSAWRIDDLPWSDDGADGDPAPRLFVDAGEPAAALDWPISSALRFDASTGCFYLGARKGQRIVWPEGTTLDEDAVVLPSGSRLSDGDEIDGWAYLAGEDGRPSPVPDVDACPSTTNYVVVLGSATAAD